MIAATPDRKRHALQFVLIVGAMSFFADFVYEGARGIAGPFLALLGASGLVVGAASGLGELAGYALRLVSGRLADRTRAYWPITIAGYVVQMAAVPALALAGSWHVAAALLVLERVGKATRNPPRDVMLSHAGKEMGGYGWAFGLHEALDQSGALLGPLALAAVLAWRHDFRLAFAVLAVPAACTLLLLVVARVRYPRTEELERAASPGHESRFPRVFWIYLVGAGLVAAGFADFPLIGFHLHREMVVRQDWIPVFYAVAMGVGGAGSLVFGRSFDRSGLAILVPLTVVTALYAPLAFLFGRWLALGGLALWGLGIGVHESVMAAAIATMVPVERRATAYGLFTAAFGGFWFLGSVLRRLRVLGAGREGGARMDVIHHQTVTAPGKRPGTADRRRWKRSPGRSPRARARAATWPPWSIAAEHRCALAPFRRGIASRRARAHRVTQQRRTRCSAGGRTLAAVQALAHAREAWA